MVRSLRIAVEGCGHGTLNAIYDSIKKTCQINKWPGVDLLIIGGDFQAVRNMQDLNIMSCPPKYRALGDFHEYYSGKKRAPYLTVFVGGNHEASSHLWELYYGGWAAPNIYYLGASSILNFRGLRIGGLSGIYNSRDYNRPHTERLPYSSGDIRSVYHVRAYDMFKLHQSQEPIDVMVSHDWPQGIELSGDLEDLLRRKPFFKPDIEKGELGSPPGKSLLYKLRPKYWFSAHLHCKFAALVDHEGGGEKERIPIQTEKKVEMKPSVKNPDELEIELDMDMDESDGGVAVPAKNSDEIELDLDDEPENLPPSAAAATKNSDEINLDLDSEPEIPPPIAAKNSDEINLDLDQPSTTSEPTPTTSASNSSSQPSSEPPKNRYTHFLALDKCLPRRDFLQILEIPTSSPAPTTTNDSGLSYDPEWLAITRTLNPYLHSPPTHSHSSFQSTSKQAGIAAEIRKQREWVEENIVQKGKLAVPDNFIAVAPVHEAVPESKWSEGPEEYESPQTKMFCELVGIENGTVESGEEKARRMVRVRERLAREAAEGRGGRGGRGGWDKRGGGGGGGGGRGGRGRGRGFRGRVRG